MYISQLIRFARVCSHVEDFNAHNKCLTANLLKQGPRLHKLIGGFAMQCTVTLTELCKNYNV